MAPIRWFGFAAVVFFGCGNSTSTNFDGGDLARVGAAFVEQRGCPSCHQPSDGAGTLAGDYAPLKGTLAFPANLTSDRVTGIGSWADIEIVRAVRFGVDNQGVGLCPTMPRFSMIGDAEAQAITAYLRSLPPVNRRIPDSNCPPIKPPPPADMAQPVDMSLPRDL